MFAIGDLQQGAPNTAWIWYSLLVIVILVVIFLLLNRRSERATEVREEESVSRKTKPSADDLTKIEGIGPKVAKVLSEANITTFDDLSRAEAAHVKDILNAASLQMMNPEGWIEQARLAAKGDWEKLEQLQDELKGGRRK